jgi:pimeloyl-ACP methyl ester carboxylesterase
MAALHAALDDSHAVHALGLLATTAGGVGLTWPSDAYLTQAASDLGSGGDLDPTEDLVLEVAVGFRTTQPALFDAFRNYSSTQPRSLDSDALAQVFLTHDVADRLNEISVPVVVVCGTEDQVHPLPNSSFLAGRLGVARLVVLEDVGHLLNVEAADILIDEIGALAASGFDDR